MKVVRVVAAVICDSMECKTKVFATARGYGDYKGKWEFPGGKIEEGESPQEALRREILEELDTQIEVGDLIDTIEYDYPDFHLSMDCFWCEVLAGHLTLKEHEAARWVDGESIREVDWLPADLTLIEQIEKALKKRPKIERLKEIVEKLRSENGCSWDKAQTHASLKAACIEEAAEVVCGINILEETGSCDNLKEELGDLLLQVMFHAVIAEEEGLFTFDDVVKGISDKMVRRHPHVFAGRQFASDEERHAAWEEIKKSEKAGREWESAYLESAMNEAGELIERAKKRKGFQTT